MTRESYYETDWSGLALATLDVRIIWGSLCWPDMVVAQGTSSSTHHDDPRLVVVRFVGVAQFIHLCSNTTNLLVLQQNRVSQSYA